MPRLSIPEEDRSKTHTVSGYDSEFAAIRRLVKALNLHSPFDVIRLALWQATERKIEIERARGSFTKPRFASARTMKKRKVKPVCR